MNGIPERFWAKVVKNDDDCWEWVGARTGAGYGHLRVAGKMVYAHRFAYEQMVGPIPDGMEIDHLCRARACCNPQHLEAVTHSVNLSRGDTRTNSANRRKSHCPSGHPYNEENTYLHRGHRYCRTCRAAVQSHR